MECICFSLFNPKIADPEVKDSKDPMDHQSSVPYAYNLLFYKLRAFSWCWHLRQRLRNLDCCCSTAAPSSKKNGFKILDQHVKLSKTVRFIITNNIHAQNHPKSKKLEGALVVEHFPFLHVLLQVFLSFWCIYQTHMIMRFCTIYNILIDIHVEHQVYEYTSKRADS